MDTMQSAIIYPDREEDEQRLALLTGIVQLVSAALSGTGSGMSNLTPSFMKSDRGVIGYCVVDDIVFISEGDGEREVEDALKAVMKNPSASDAELSSEVESALRRRGKEIGDLWR